MVESIATNGLGASVTDLLTNSGSFNIEDYRISYFKLGFGDQPLTKELYSLDRPYPEAGYGEDTQSSSFNLEYLHDPGGAVSSLIPSNTFDTTIYLPLNQISNADGATKVKYTVDQYINRSAPFTEMALFIKNPKGYKPHDKPVMAFYATFDDYRSSPLDSNNQNILLPLQWIITFIDNS